MAPVFSRFASSSLALSGACSRVTFRCKSAGAVIQFYGMPANVSRRLPRRMKNRRCLVVPPPEHIDSILR